MVEMNSRTGTLLAIGVAHEIKSYFEERDVSVSVVINPLLLKGTIIF